MPQLEDSSLSALVDHLRDEQRRRWSEGDRVAAETVLDHHPRVRDHAEHALEFIYGEVLLREERGEFPAIEEYARRFPRLADRLVLLFEVHRAIESGRLLDSTDPGATPGSTEPSSSPGSTWPIPKIKGYDVLEEIGRGGMGVVYRAKQQSLNRFVALKVILAGGHAGKAQVDRFRAEAEAVARLQHPNVVQIHDVGEQDGRPFFALELVEGGSLARRLHGTPQPASRAASWTRTLARAVEAAHKKGIIHRDLKPTNILLAADGTLKITDFGLAKAIGADAGLTRSEAVMGSPSYMAPEQASGNTRDVGPAADVYSLGAILYELLTGRPPFAAATPLETLEQVRSADPIRPGRLRSGVPRDLETICLKCLEKEPVSRYHSAQELAEELGRFLSGEPIRARPIGRLALAARWCRRRPALAGMSALAAAALVAVVVVLTSYGFHQARAARELGAALGEARKLSSSLTFERGQALCEQGDINAGVLWLARSLEMSERTDSPALGRVIRANLAGWTPRLHALHFSLEHPSAVNAIAFGPGASLVATGADDGAVTFWDSATGREIGPPLICEGAIASVAFSRGGERILTREKSGSVVLWNHATRSRIGPPLLHPGVVSNASFSPDGHSVLTAGDDGSLRFWKVADGRSSGLVLWHGEPVRVAIFSPAGRLVFAAGPAHARIWDSSSNKPLLTLAHDVAHDGAVQVAAFSPDGSILATGSENGIARLWSAASGLAVGEPMRHDARVVVLAFSPSGETLLTASLDWRARLWNPATGASIGQPMRHQDMITSAQFHPDGRSVLTGSVDGTARLWDVATTTAVGPPMTHRGEVHAVAFNLDGRTVATASSPNAVQLWQIRGDLPGPTMLSYEGWPTAIAFDSGGRRVAVGGLDHSARILDVVSGMPVGSVLRHDDEVTAISFSHDGKVVASGGDDRAIRLWDSGTGRSIATPITQPEKIHSLAFSPDDRVIAAGTRSGMILLWDVATGSLLRERKAHAAPVSAVVFHPSGTRLLTGSADQTARLWSTDTLEPIGGPLGHQGRVWAAAFDPQGHLAATGGADKAIRLWNAATGAPAGPSIINREPIRVIVFSPRGETVLVGGWAGTSRLWDLATRQPLGPSPHQDGIVLAAAFDPSGSRVLSGCDDKTLRAHAIPIPVTGDAASITRAVQLMTNTEIDSDGGIQSLDPRRWKQIAAVPTPMGPEISGKRTWREAE